MEKIYSTYNARLQQLMQFNFGVIIFISCVIVALIFFLLKMKNGKLAIIAFVVGSILVTGTYFFSTYPYQKDISEQTYIRYTGEFYVEECSSYNRSGSYIFIKTAEEKTPTRYKVACDVKRIKSNTTYIGDFVYAKHSKTLVDISESNTGDLTK